MDALTQRRLISIAQANGLKAGRSDCGFVFVEIPNGCTVTRERSTEAVIVRDATELRALLAARSYGRAA